MKTKMLNCHPMPSPVGATVGTTDESPHCSTAASHRTVRSSADASPGESARSTSADKERSQSRERERSISFSGAETVTLAAAV